MLKEEHTAPSNQGLCGKARPITPKPAESTVIGWYSMWHNDVVIREGFPEGWSVQDRRGDNQALLCLQGEFSLFGSTCICLRPAAISTEDWLPTARLIARGFDAARNSRATPEAVQDLTARLRSGLDNCDRDQNGLQLGGIIDRMKEAADMIDDLSARLSLSAGRQAR